MFQIESDAANHLINVYISILVKATACCDSDSIHHHMQSTVFSEVPITASDNECETGRDVPKD